MPLQLLPGKDAHEFKPLLTEIEERPIAPTGRLTFWVLIVLLIATAAWLCLAEIDVVVTARGKVIPDGHVKILQPLETGVVESIKVKEGDFVRKGQVLMEIDPSITEPELQASRQQLSLAQLEIARLRATISGGGFTSTHQTQRQLHDASLESLNRQLSAKGKELEQITAQVEQTTAELRENQELLSIASEREARLSTVADIVSRRELDAVKSEVITLQSNVEQSQRHLEELAHEQGRIKHEREQIKQSYRTTNLEQLAEREKAATDLRAREDELSFKHRKQRLCSPVDGIVDQLFVHTVGGVVTPAEKLLSIMPNRTPLLIDAEVSNDDIGFVKPDLPVSIKVDTFDFQKYGMMEGRVKLVSRDSHDDEKRADNLYQVYVLPTRSTLVIDGQKEQLSSGMTVTCEIKVGKRKIIEFFVYPLLRGFHNGLSVR